MDERYELADENGMSHDFIDWFFEEKKAACGNVWFMMMAAMWEGWKGREEHLSVTIRITNIKQVPSEGLHDVIS